LWEGSPRKKRSKTRGSKAAETRAGVADLELCKTVVAAQFDAHQAIWLIVFDGVVSQIEQQLAQAMAVSLNEDLVAPSRMIIRVIYSP